MGMMVKKCCATIRRNWGQLRSRATIEAFGSSWNKFCSAKRTSGHEGNESKAVLFAREIYLLIPSQRLSQIIAALLPLRRSPNAIPVLILRLLLVLTSVCNLTSRRVHFNRPPLLHTLISFPVSSFRLTYAPMSIPFLLILTSLLYSFISHSPWTLNGLFTLEMWYITS